MNTPNITNVFDLIYPIGSIYLSVSDVSPASLFGGSWERITDRFLLGAGGSYSSGATGGEASHVLTVNEMPSHRHTVQHWYGAGSSGTGYVPAGSIANSVAVRTDIDGISDTGGTFTDRPSGNYQNSSLIGYNGGSASHNNMPPYLAVYIWKRVS